MPRRRKLQVHEIGEGFFDDLMSQAQDAIHKHSDQQRAKHLSDLKGHMRTGASRLFAAKDKRAELNSMKNELVQHGVGKAQEVAEYYKEKAHKHVERFKHKAVSRVRSRVCGAVGEGFFDSLFKGVKSGVGKLIGAGRKAATTAVRQGIQTVKNKVKEAPGVLMKHVREHKDEYIQNAMEGMADVAANGKEGFARQMGKARTGMVKKVRSVAGCEGEERGEGLKRRRRKKKGGSLLSMAKAVLKKQDAVPLIATAAKKAKAKGRGVRMAGGLRKKKKTRRGRGMRMAGGLSFKGSGLRIVS